MLFSELHLWTWEFLRPCTFLRTCRSSDSVILRSGHLHFFYFGGGGSPFLTSISGRGWFTVKLTGLKWQASSCHWICEFWKLLSNRGIWVEIKDPGFYQEPFLYIHHWYISKSELGYQGSNNLLWFIFLF